MESSTRQISPLLKLFFKSCLMDSYDIFLNESKCQTVFILIVRTRHFCLTLWWRKYWSSVLPLDGNVVTRKAASLRKVKLTLHVSNPVISGVMDADRHYYLLIAPHSNSSTFEDQSSRVPLCVPTAVNPEWTSIKPTVHFVHLSLTLFQGLTRWNAVEPRESTVAHGEVIRELSE